MIRLAMQRAMAAGYRRIGFVMHRGMDQNVDHLWTAGFLGEQANFHRADRIPMLHFPERDSTDPWMTGNESDAMASPPAFRRWYEEYRLQVIISKWSFVQCCFAAFGLRIPQDVAFVDVFLEDTSTRVAGVRQNHEEVGGLAVEILAGQLHRNIYGVPQIATTTFVEGTWFDGASCPMTNDTQVARQRNACPIPVIL